MSIPNFKVWYNENDSIKVFDYETQQFEIVDRLPESINSFYLPNNCQI